MKKICLLTLCLFALFTVQAQDISGRVYNDANNNGTQDGFEVGYPYVTVNAYAPGALVPTATAVTQSGVSLGDYTITGLTAGVKYRIEFVSPLGYHDGGYAAAVGHSSVQFADAGSININYGIRYANECTVASNPRLIAGQSYTYNGMPGGGSGTNALMSWLYNDRTITQCNTCQVALGYGTYAGADLSHASGVGAPTSVSFDSEKKMVYFSSWTAVSGVFPMPTDGYYSLHVANYGGVGNSFIGAKLLVDLPSIGVDVTPVNQLGTFPDNSAGTAGLGQVAVSNDGNSLFVVNMSKGNIVKINVTNVDYNSLPVTAPTAADVSYIDIPANIPNAIGGIFRPFALKLKGNVLYVGGVNDASVSQLSTDLEMVVLRIDINTNTITKIFSHNLSTFTASITQQGYGSGGIWGLTQLPWSAAHTSHTFVPFFNSIEFDDYGAMLIGITNRVVYTSASAWQAGYLVRAEKTLNGYQLENAGISGGFTSAARNPGNYTPGNNTSADGPGGEWFFENEYTPPHGNCFAGGIYVLPGSGEVVAGYIDPTAWNEEGARYFNANNGVTVAGKATQAGKAATLTGTEAVCDANPVEIGNRVWLDANGNGVQDGNELPAVGVTLVLTLHGSNTVIATAVTDNNGNYIFSSRPGTNAANAIYNLALVNEEIYDIKVISLGVGPAYNGYYLNSLSPLVGETANMDNTGSTVRNNDAFMVGNTPVVQVKMGAPGENNYTYDIGFKYGTAQLGNYVWNDLDKDGIQDANEVGVAGITVSLYNNANQLIGTTITDAYGYYKFNPLAPGTYKVGFTLPANYVFTSQNAGADDEFDSDASVSGITGNYILVAGDSNMSVDAGIHFVNTITASVGNYVWFDTDKDGIQDAGEQGISGVTVTLYNQAGSVVATMLTDANGYYLFTDVTPGTYYVGFSTPPGLTITVNNGAVNDPSNSDANPNNGLTGTFTVVGGSNITYIDAGMHSVDNPVLGGLGDKVWNDINHNGIQEANEPGVQGVTVTLYQADGVTVISTTTTDAFGNYVFNSLPAGQYIVGFSNLPVDYVFTSYNVGVDSTINSDANIATGKTNIINLAAGQYNMTYDAGIYNTNLGNTNSIGDYVWNDTDKDGIQDAGETGVSGVTVTLYDAFNNVVAITSTNSNGYYLFPDLPNGTYYVGFSNIPVGYVFSPAGQGNPVTNSDADPSTGLTYSVSLTGNTHITDLDAGINQGNTKFIGKGSIGDKVWYDTDNDGLQDANEGGVPGITVTLYASDGVTVIATTITNALGEYIFTGLDPATYIVGFSNLPVGFTVATKDADGQGINGAGNSDANPGTQKTDPIVLGLGEDKLTVDMGLVPPAGTASLGNFVWFDLNNDGLQTADEPGVQGVMVELIDASGIVIASTTTNLNGEYYFVGLTPGSYSVQFSNLPSGYQFTAYNADLQGINGTVNSDADPISGATQTVTLVSGDNNVNLDAGIRSNTVASVGDYVWFDVNQNGIQDANEPGIGGILVILYDINGTAVASTITNSDGGYIFTNVLPGTYTIGFENIPAGLVFTTQEADPLSNTGSNVNPNTGLTIPFTVTAGTHNPTIDAGLTTPLVAGLGNYVWHDVNENGLQDAGEPGVAGVLVSLYAADGVTLLATASTDGNGAYTFTNLPEGTYVVGFSSLPVGSTRTQNVGALNDPLNSDMKPGGKTDPVTIGAGTYNPNIDAGIYYGFPLTARQLQATIAILESEDKCNVNWFTATEMNTKDFYIERSIDGKTFTKVGEKNASGNTNGKTYYNFVDDVKAIADVPVIYYRIRLNDIDAQVSYSNIITARPVNETNVFIYPSAFDDKLYIEYTSQDNSAVEISLSDVVGQTILKKTFNVEEGFNKLTLNELSGMATGTYYLKLINQDFGEKYIIKVLKK